MIFKIICFKGRTNKTFLISAATTTSTTTTTTTPPVIASGGKLLLLQFENSLDISPLVH